MVENRKVSRSQIQGLEDKIERSNYDYFKLKKKERKESYSTIEGMARLDCELMVTNVLECELPEEGRTRLRTRYLCYPMCGMPANHMQEL